MEARDVWFEKTFVWKDVRTRDQGIGQLVGKKGYVTGSCE